MIEQKWNPCEYDQAAAFVSDKGGDLLPLLAPRAGERILDLGCGTGSLALALAATGAEVVGVDSSEEMVAAAREKAPGVRFEVADGQALSFDDEFDAVFSNAALHWMPRAGDVARGVAKALRKGGRFVAEFGGKGCIDTVRRAMEGALSALGEDPVLAPAWFFPSVGGYASLLEEHGFGVRMAALFDRPTRMEGDRGLEAWLTLFAGRLLAGLGTRAPALIAKVEDTCRPSLFRDDGWTLDYVRLRIVASKR